MTSRLFVGSYADAAEPGIVAFSLDESSGDLRQRGAVSGVPSPSFLAVGPGGASLYAVGETGRGSDGEEGSVHSFRIEDDGESVTFVPIDRRSTGGDHPCHLAIDPSGRWLAASNYSSGDVAVFAIDDPGGLGEMAAFVRHEGSGPNADRQSGPHAHSAIFTPNGEALIVADLGIDRLVVYRFDPKAGSLDRMGEGVAAPGAGPRHMAWQPDGTHLLVANELDSTLTRYTYDGSSLERDLTTSTVPEPEPGNLVADLHVRGGFVYVSNRGHDSIATFDLDGLRFLGTRSCGGHWPRSFAVAPAGAHLVVANRHTDEVTVLAIRDGRPAEVVGRATVAEPSHVVFG